MTASVVFSKSPQLALVVAKNKVVVVVWYGEWSKGSPELSVAKGTQEHTYKLYSPQEQEEECDDENKLIKEVNKKS